MNVGYVHLSAIRAASLARRADGSGSLCHGTEHRPVVLLSKAPPQLKLFVHCKAGRAKPGRFSARHTNTKEK